MESFLGNPDNPDLLIHRFYETAFRSGYRGSAAHRMDRIQNLLSTPKEKQKPEVIEL